MARTITLIAAALLVLSATTFARAQEEPPPAPAATEAKGAQEPVEEVVVRGRRTLFSLRRDMQSARENVWEVFSAINSDDDFDIACTSAPRTGSHVKSRACRPQYADKATRRAGQDLGPFATDGKSLDPLTKAARLALRIRHALWVGRTGAAAVSHQHHGYAHPESSG